jgi:DNA repair protein RadC
MNIKLSKATKVKVNTSPDIYKVMQQVLLRENKIDRNKEHFWTIGLDNAHRVLYIELVSLGGTRLVPAEPMQVFRVGVLKAAVKLILVHNHPSGELEPSIADKDITDRLIQVGKILDIPVLDHLIINEKTYYSFGDTGLLDELENSMRYVPNYQRQAQIKREAEKIGEERKAINIARYLKGKGFTVAQIVEATGITEAEAKKLKAQKPKKP